MKVIGSCKFKQGRQGRAYQAVTSEQTGGGSKQGNVVTQARESYAE